MDKGKVSIALSMVLFVLLMSLVLSSGGLGTILPPPDLRRIASLYLGTTYTPWRPEFSVMSPEAVTAIVWDYRGLDTLFETVVFYLAIIGSIAIMRGIYAKKKEIDLNKAGLSLIVKSVTKITLGMIIAVAASIALHGHLTPGGGFQGGASAAVAPLLMLVVFSSLYMEMKGVTKNTMLMLRSIGLLGVGITAFLAIIIAYTAGGTAFVFQNQPKYVYQDHTRLQLTGLPASINGVLISGTLFFFNLFEMLAVAAGFTIIFLLLAVPEEEVLEVIRGEESGGH
ncbi:sodium:proton antiporter [Desulfurococcaceae archaeon MEX13E-LK6-19]|nr:sodium:proton antiporter [Desulfurococcaceae archaeon MEX13E-LK6-19]